MQTNINRESLMLVDGHVHLHDCFDVELLLDSALNNFQNLSYDNAVFFLALTESKSQNYFQRLYQLAQGHEDLELILNNWQIELTDESCSLRARKSNTNIYIIAGRQIVTVEKLEVLALLTDETFADGSTIEKTIDRVLKSGGIPVIPWGFGKWMGKRGKILSKLLKSPINGFFLADNSGRPIFWQEPKLFEQALQQKIGILSGSDPFPLKSESDRPGKAGFSISGTLDPQKPASSLRKMLLHHNSSPQTYGALETPWRFLRNQVAIQYLKYLKK